MSHPDFILIGAMKCGTSTLAAQLGAQSDVFMTTPKEPNFFSDDDVFALGHDWYRSLFADAAPGDIKGEASTHYTKFPTYPQTVTRMQSMLKAPRLIYMIRNPLERAVSHYLHEWSEGRMSGDPVEAFEKASEIIEYGCYARQLEPFLEAYGRASVHLTSLEQIKFDPHAAFAACAVHLGCADARWIDDLPAQNITAERVRRLPLQGLLIDNPVATALRRTLVPKAMRSWVRDKRKPATRPEIPPALQARMQTRFLTDRAELAKVFPGHPALDLCYPFAFP